MIRAFLKQKIIAREWGWISFVDLASEVEDEFRHRRSMGNSLVNASTMSVLSREFPHESKTVRNVVLIRFKEEDEDI